MRQVGVVCCPRWAIASRIASKYHTQSMSEDNGRSLQAEFDIKCYLYKAKILQTSRPGYRIQRQRQVGVVCCPCWATASWIASKYHIQSMSEDKARSVQAEFDIKCHLHKAKIL